MSILTISAFPIIIIRNNQEELILFDVELEWTHVFLKILCLGSTAIWCIDIRHEKLKGFYFFQNLFE